MSIRPDHARDDSPGWIVPTLIAVLVWILCLGIFGAGYTWYRHKAEAARQALQAQEQVRREQEARKWAALEVAEKAKARAAEAQQRGHAR